MGSGGMIVMDDSSCMVDVAKFFMEFCKSESCGKCVPCRVGTYQMYELLQRITEGHAGAKELAALEELCDLVQKHQPVRAWPVCSQPGHKHFALFSR